MTIAESTITFTDARRHARTAQLMLQQDSPRAFALIAHGFPGGEPGRVIAEGLAAAGISTLRFDCGSGDDDAVGDLMAASAYLRERHAAPTLLVGHAEGGTASLGAARRIPEVRAVVTIGAPAPQEPPKFEAALLILQASSDEEVGMEEARKVNLAARGNPSRSSRSTRPTICSADPVTRTMSPGSSPRGLPATPWTPPSCRRSAPRSPSGLPRARWRYTKRATAGSSSTSAQAATC